MIKRVIMMVFIMGIYQTSLLMNWTRLRPLFLAWYIASSALFKTSEKTITSKDKASFGVLKSIRITTSLIARHPAKMLFSHIVPGK